MKKIIYIIAILLAGVIAAGIASSDSYNTPTATTVRQIIAHPIDGMHVTLTGQVTQSLGYRHYMFSDGTGTIMLDPDHDFPSSYFPLNTKLVVMGEVDHEDGVLEVDVDWVTAAS